MTAPILICGAAHLDIVGEYSRSAASVTDKPGEIIYSVGGTAYNVAANVTDLVKSNVPVP